VGGRRLKRTCQKTTIVVDASRANCRRGVDHHRETASKSQKRMRKTVAGAKKTQRLVLKKSREKRRPRLRRKLSNKTARKRELGERKGRRSIVGRDRANLKKALQLAQKKIAGSPRGREEIRRLKRERFDEGDPQSATEVKAGERSHARGKIAGPKKDAKETSAQ